MRRCKLSKKEKGSPEIDPGTIQKVALYYAKLFEHANPKVVMALICHLTDGLIKRSSARDVVEGLDLLIHQIMLENDISEDI